MEDSEEKERNHGQDEEAQERWQIWREADSLMPGVLGPKFRAAIKRRKAGKLGELGRAFGTRRAGQPGGAQRTVTVSDPGKAIRATQKAVRTIQRTEGLTGEQAAKRLRGVGKSIRQTRARLSGISSGRQSRLAAGKSSSFDISRTALTRKLSIGIGKGTEASVISHVISSEIARPTTRLNIGGTRQTTRRRARRLLGIKK